MMLREQLNTKQLKSKQLKPEHKLKLAWQHPDDHCGDKVLKNKQANNIIRLIINCIIREYKPDKIILFGSWARGEATEKSDIDLLIISDHEQDMPRYKRGLELRLQLSRFQIPKDILFYTHKDVKRWQGIPQAFINTVLSEGQVLYER